MWQQQDLFQVHGSRLFLNECQQHLEVSRSAAAAATTAEKFFSSSSTTTTSLPSAAAADLCCWQRAANLVQSPASANSESSTATSTPDQCPAASSPAATLCEMPGGSWNGCNNVTMVSSSKDTKNVPQWRNLPSPPQAPVLASHRSFENWSPKELDFVSPEYHHQVLPWNESPSTVRSYMMEGLNEALVSKSEFTSPRFHTSLPVDPCDGSQSGGRLPSSFADGGGRASSSFGGGTLFEAQRIKQEIEHFPSAAAAAVTNTTTNNVSPLVIDDKILASLHTTSTNTSSSSSPRVADSSSSKIGNFIDLLRQSDRPVSDATAAASCNHLSQLLTSQEAPGMWSARSSRLPAMLSEVLPQSPPVIKPGEKSKRPLPLSPSSNADITTVHRQESMKSKHQEVDDSGLLDHRATPAAACFAASNDDLTSELFTKRPRIENSSSFPFKMQVRKEKLGERISALQQLVSPFGKTDTASVLLEAIGYIKFLHEQVQVLSSPYMKQTSRHNEHGKFCWSSCDKELEDARLDLRSRGLCLVPISCTLQVANDNGADYWTPTLHGNGGLK